MRRLRHPSLLIALLLCATANAQTPRIDPAGISGALLLCGSYQPSPAVFSRFVELAGGAKAKIVIVTVDNARWSAPPLNELTAAAKKLNAAAPSVVDYLDAGKALRDATGVWLHVDSTNSWGKALKAKSIADDARAVLKRGGVIASAAAGIRHLGTRENAANGAPCLNLLPDSMIEPAGKSKAIRMPSMNLVRQKGLVLYDIPADAAMLVQGRKIRVLGEGKILTHVMNDSYVHRGALQGNAAEDLTALRRYARDRAEGFPPLKVEPPFVKKGTLVIVGGGGSPAGLYKKFIEYAGGEGKAVIAMFPTANGDPLPKREQIAQAFRKAGAKKATVLYAQKQADVESKEFLDALKEATGLWFDGGRQWRFVDCYENTKALPLMFDVLKRGGVIGGTSAGATIQGDYLARGGIFTNFDIRYLGYERGLGFLKGVAIDQHFSQRKRQKDMTNLMKLYPQYLGIGLDEATAIVVKGSIAEVIGKGRAHFYDAQRKVEKGQPDYDALSAGGRYELKARRVLVEK